MTKKMMMTMTDCHSESRSIGLMFSGSTKKLGGAVLRLASPMTPSKVWNWPVAIALLDRHRTVPKPPEEADQQHRTMTKAAEPASSAKEENTQNLRFSPDIRKNRSRQKQKKKLTIFRVWCCCCCSCY